MPLRRSNPRESIIRRLSLTILAAAVWVAALGVSPGAHAQQLPADSAARHTPLGTWCGTSICTPGHPACHDETVVYRIRAADERFLELKASKIVRGEEEPMFTEICDHDATAHVLNCPAISGYGVWSFAVDGDRMTGTLTVRGELYRRISVTRSAN